MNLTLRNFIAFDYYRTQRRREKRREALRRKRRCPPAPPPSPASPPPPPPASPPPPLPHPKPVKRKSATVRAYAFNSSDSDYSPHADSNESDSDFSTPRKRTKLFSDDDEIKILRGLLYMNKNNDKKTMVTDEVAEHINRSLRRRNADFTKTQFRSKIRGIKDKYNKNIGKEGKFFNLCAKIWGDNKGEEPMNSSPARVLFENDSNAHDSCAGDTDVTDFPYESYVVEDSYAEDSEYNSNEHQDKNEKVNQDINEDLIVERRAESKKKFNELDIMTLQLFSKRLTLMKETVETVLEAIQ